MKDYLEEQGIKEIIGSRGTVRYAFNNGLIKDGQVWMDMIDDRNITSHWYDEETADKIYSKIVDFIMVN